MGFLDSFGKDAIKKTKKETTKIPDKKSWAINQLLFFLSLIAMGVVVVWLFGGLSPASIGSIIGVALVSLMSAQNDILTYKRKEKERVKNQDSETNA